MLEIHFIDLNDVYILLGLKINFSRCECKDAVSFRLSCLFSAPAIIQAVMLLAPAHSFHLAKLKLTLLFFPAFVPSIAPFLNCISVHHWLSKFFFLMHEGLMQQSLFR
jgi:hypothetical protein